jgi:hypothetical protein
MEGHCLWLIHVKPCWPSVFQVFRIFFVARIGETEKFEGEFGGPGRRATRRMSSRWYIFGMYTLRGYMLHINHCYYILIYVLISNLYGVYIYIYRENIVYCKYIYINVYKCHSWFNVQSWFDGSFVGHGNFAYLRLTRCCGQSHPSHGRLLHGRGKHYLFTSGKCSQYLWRIIWVHTSGGYGSKAIPREILMILVVL